MAKKRKTEIRIVCRGDVLKPVDEIVPYERNAKIHGEKQVAALRKSLRTLGFVRPLLIDAQGNLIAGHGTLMAAKAEGMTAVPCNLAEGLTDAQRRAYILADNRLAEMAEWDMPMVLSELQALELEDIDLSMLDFDLGEMALDSVPEEPEPAQDAEADQVLDDDAEYQAFLDKFKPKHTTDDCYTPEPVYRAVAEWVAAEYGVNPEDMVRPFYPGGDYERFEYAPGSVVVDNPPFSILSKICRFYTDAAIQFFLFAPHLTVLNVSSAHAVVCGIGITYENGAVVNTSFVTSLDKSRVRSAPELYQAVRTANDARSSGAATMPKYTYPTELVTASSMAFLSKHGVDFHVPPESCCFVKSLHSQKESGSTIFGGGLLISEKAAAEKAAAEKAAAEKAAAEKAAAEKAAAEKVDARVWTLSSEELEIVRHLP